MSSLEFNDKDQFFMKLAIRHAQFAFRENEVPVGAILVDADGEIIAASRNRVEIDVDCTAHAEIDCIRKASKLRNNWRLQDCTIYTTLEPCGMCLSAIQSSRIKRIVYGAKDCRLGACGSWVDLVQSNPHPFHNVEVTGGVLESESSMLLKRFFQLRRRENLVDGNICDRGRDFACEESSNHDITESNS